MDEQLASVVAAAFPDREVRRSGSTGPSWNEQNQTFGVEFADGDVVYVKLATDGDGSRIVRERAVLDYVDERGAVPVPTVVASDPDATVPSLVTEQVPGERLLGLWGEGDEAARETMARQVGRGLASLHECRFGEHGRIVGGDADGLELETGTWTDVLRATLAEMRALAPSDRFDGYFDEVAAAVEANRSLLDDAPATLLHGDPARPNCFRTDGEVGLLDWERAHVGDPARDVYRTDDQQFCSLREPGPERFRDAFFDGYRERAGGLPDGYEKRRPVYEAVRFLGTVGFFDNWVEFLDESPAELAAWMETEMERRLAAIQ